MFVTTTMDCLHLIDGKAFVCILLLVMSFSFRSLLPTVRSRNGPLFMSLEVVFINSSIFDESFLDYLEVTISFLQVY